MTTTVAKACAWWPPLNKIKQNKPKPRREQPHTSYVQNLQPITQGADRQQITHTRT
jgi:hypothetical protein